MGEVVITLPLVLFSGESSQWLSSLISDVYSPSLQASVITVFINIEIYFSYIHLILIPS